MNKKERERKEALQAWRRKMTAAHWKDIDEFEKGLGAETSDYRLATYRQILHKAILSLSESALAGYVENNGDVVLSEDRLDRVAKLMLSTAKLAAVTHKITVDIERMDTRRLELYRRGQAKASKNWRQPHAQDRDLDHDYVPPYSDASPGTRTQLDGPRGRDSLQSADEKE